MKEHDFEHNSCYSVINDRCEGPVCEACLSHAREKFREIVDAIKELDKLSDDYGTNK